MGITISLFWLVRLGVFEEEDIVDLLVNTAERVALRQLLLAELGEMVVLVVIVEVIPVGLEDL